MYSLKKVWDGEIGYEDQDERHHNSPKLWLWSILDGCGCGSNEELAEDAFKVLEYFATKHENREDLFDSNEDSKYYELLAHWLDKEDLIDHGTIIYSSWLTDSGKEVYENIKKLLN